MAFTGPTQFVGPTPTTNTQAVATVPKTDTLSPAFQAALLSPTGAKYQGSSGETFTTPIIGAKQAIDHYTTVQNDTNKIAQGVAQQAQNQAQISQQPTQTPTTETTPANQPAPDNSDLVKALGSATEALGGSTAPTPEDQQIATNNKQLSADQATIDTATQQFNDTIAKITNGTFPLNPTQQATLNQTQSAVQDLIKSVNLSSQLYQQNAQILGATTGIQRYQPALQLQNINQAMVKGQQEIAKAEMDGAKQLADLQKRFQTDDFNMITKSYDALVANLDKKDTLINKMNSDIQTQVKDAQAAQEKQQTNARTALNTLLTQFGGLAFEDLTPTQQAQMNQLEQMAGFPPGIVKSGMQTVAQQKNQATQQLAEQRLADQQAQLKIANSFREAALAISAQNASNNQSTKTLSADEINNVFSNANSFTANGKTTPYLTPDNLANYTPDQKAIIAKAASAAGVPNLSANEVKQMDNIQASKADLQGIASMLKSLNVNPTTWYGRPLSSASTDLKTWLQTNGQLDAYNTWQLTAMPILGSLSSSGGGGGRAVKFLANIENSIPKLTDTLDTAKSKLTVLNTILNEGANATLGVKTNVKIQDPKTGKVRVGQDLSPQDLNDAIKQGYKIIE